MRDRQRGGGWAWTLLVLGMGLSWAAAARAAEAEGAAEAAPPAPNRDQLWYTNALFGRLNPLGLINRLSVGYKRRLELGTGKVLKDTYVFVAATTEVSPAFGRVGVHVEAEPVAVLQLGAKYMFTGYLGTFDSITGFPSSDVTFDDVTLDQLGAQGQTRVTYGHLVTAWAQPKAKLGPVAVRDTITVTWHDLVLRDGEVAFWDVVNDRLAPDGGVILTNDADVLGIVGKATFGARYTYTASFFPAGSTGDGTVPHHRLGPLFGWTFHDRNEAARWDRPTLFLLAQWWIAHPYRAGQVSSQGYPMIALGLAFEGDMLSSSSGVSRRRLAER